MTDTPSAAYPDPHPFQLRWVAPGAIPDARHTAATVQHLTDSDVLVYATTGIVVTGWAACPRALRSIVAAMFAAGYTLTDTSTHAAQLALRTQQQGD